MSGAQEFDLNEVIEALRVAIIEERAGQAHGSVGALLRDAMPKLRAHVLASTTHGHVAAKRLSRDFDLLIKVLFDGIENAPFTLCAVGGYGRSRLAPFSDIDLLVLHKNDDTELTEDIGSILYPLWDGGMKVGHSVHTPASAIEFAKSDMVGRTAYLDTRYLCGDKKLFEDFATRYDKFRKRTIKEFVVAKLKEQDERQAKAGETRYLAEPDIKNAKGGLRDLHTIFWLYKYASGIENEFENIVIDHFDDDERRAYTKAGRFLWSVRVRLHECNGRAGDQLTFELQPQVAERLGYTARPGMSASERLMKHYFINAAEVGRLTRILCTRFEEENTKRLPRLPARLPKALQSDEARGAPNICIRNGRLDFKNAGQAQKRPRDFFRLFRAFSKSDKLDFHPDALALVTANLSGITAEVRADPAIANLFEGMMTDSPHPARTLRLMSETGLLGKYIPVFGKIIGRINYGLYRRYTLDEQVLKSLDVLHKIRGGEMKKEHPIATRIVGGSEHVYLFYLSILLHESRWGVREGNLETSQKLASRAASELGLGKQDAKDVGWATANHYVMARTAERRNLTDARSIIDLGKLLGERRHLDLALVLAVCHLHTVGEDGWENLTTNQLADLYEGVSEWFDGGAEAVEAWLHARADKIRAATKAKLTSWKRDEVDAWLATYSDEMIGAFGAQSLATFAQLSRAALKDGAEVAVKVTPKDQGLEVIVYADDRPGLLADLAGAIAERGLDVCSFRGVSVGDGKIFDVFTLRGDPNLILDGGDFSRRLHAALVEVAKVALVGAPQISTRIGDRRALFDVPSELRIENNGSDRATIVETQTLDRPGLLFELSSALNGLGVTITSAHVATYGERAVDTFYLKAKNGGKITDERALADIERVLMGVLSAGS